jgi:PAT family beta-lactamase induction signal transducer AmpG
MGKHGRRTVTVTAALGLLYLAQGVPFGFATEYLPVVLREQGYTYSAIAALSWLQLPWQLKVLWAKAADHPRVRPRARSLIFGLQIALTMTVAAFGLRTLRDAPGVWFALTALAATLAATQDVFVDAFAVRVLLPSERGYGNTAQVAGYRLGMLVGGAALLLLVGALGERTTLLACAAVVGACTVGAFASSGAAEALRASPPETDAATDAETDAAAERDAEKDGREPKTVAALTRHMLGRDAWVVLAFALTFKLGLHMAGSLLKPMAVDYGWTRQQIGWAVVTVGSISALLGASAGGALHRLTTERRALTAALVVQALTCLPLIFVERLHAPLGLTTFAIAAEHFGSGLGTTVLFAALMSATRPADAGLHYTILTSANAVAIGVGGLAGGLVADHAGKLTAFVVATIVCVLPAAFLPRWHRAASASSGGAVTGS